MTNSTTTSTPTTAAPGARTILRWLLVVVGVVAGLVLLTAWGVLMLADWRTRSQLNRLRDSGNPASLADLEALHPLLSRETVGANLWLQAAIILTADDSPELYRLLSASEFGDPLPDSLGELQERRAIELMQRAAGIDAAGSARYAPHVAVYYPLRSSADGRVDFPHVVGLRQCLHLLQTELADQLRDQDTAGAARTLHCMLRLGRSLENESNLPGALAKCASDGLTCHEMLLALPQLPFTDDDLRGWQAELRTIDPPAAFRAALVGQRILDGLPLIDPLAEDPSFQPDLMWRLSRGNELQWYLDQVDLMIDATDRSWMEAKAVGNAISARLPVGPAPRAAAPGQAATLRLAPIFSASCSAVARWSANARATDAAIAAELYRRRNGTFPDRLDDLVPDFLPGVPRDPFDQQPLRYHPGDAACIIYSVGRNGRDDGGATHDDFEGDLLYELRAPPGAVAPVVVPAAAGGN